ncbi:hypothetical protein [Shewanella frigidimarina]|uniref:Uncharacterized protein n=1 Tax=Shewanella frigidimarina TaxID=56812 RepID=A0A106C202_SHEFR|nr:hypothetical protein [Shewanella frigidimarina]KVX02771.1 hypothetical protein AWJ07_12850 [Shewanella frigidimarina]
MAKRNRSTLKNYFRKGALPSADHFSDLIDSCLNTLEEGFDKSVNDGFKVSSLEENAHLMSFYRESAPDQQLWSIQFDKEIDVLLFSSPQVQHANKEAENKLSGSNGTSAAPDKSGSEQGAQSLLALSPNACVGINCDRPSHTLEVNGTLKSSGRKGGAFEKANTGILPVKADGNWHTISPKLEGCQALEIMAGVGIKSTGRYGLLRAVAMNSCDPDSWWFDVFNWFNVKTSIKSQHAYYTSSADKLCLRWVKQKQQEKGQRSEAYRPYYLQIRSNTDYGEGIYIRYHITKLWFDDYMQDCILSPEEAGDEN